MDRDIDPRGAFLIQSFEDIHDLFECLENTFLECMEDLKAARESTDRITNGVEKLVTSFDEHEVCVIKTHLPSSLTKPPKGSVE
jgi:hypothetical protein